MSSLLYNGGGTANAMQVKTTGATAIASGANLIDNPDCDRLDVQLFNATAAQAATVRVIEYSGVADNATVPTLAQMVRQTEAAAGTEQTGTVDQIIVGLTTGTEISAKPPMAFTVMAGHKLQIVLSALAGGTGYVRYALYKSK